MTRNSASYWHFLLQSKGRHGVHSPFVFELIDKGLTFPIDKNFLKERKKWLNDLARDTKKFDIVDLGAGSHRLAQKRSVADLAKHASSKGMYGNLIWRLCRYFKPTYILELGTSIGTGTITMKHAAPKSHVITVEGCPNTELRAIAQFERWKLTGVTTLQMDFDAFLENKSHQKYDLVFIDGNHQGAALLRYLELLDAQTHDETLFILDDIRWSSDMWDAWQQVVASDKYHVTIDMGRMGLIWKRPQQTKEHFVQRPVVWKNRLF